MGLSSFVTNENKSIPAMGSFKTPLYLIHPEGNIALTYYDGYTRFNQIGSLYTFTALENLPQLVDCEDADLAFEIGMMIIDAARHLDSTGEPETILLQCSTTGVFYTDNSIEPCQFLVTQMISNDNDAVIERVEYSDIQAMSTNADFKHIHVDLDALSFLPQISSNKAMRYSRGNGIIQACPYQGFLYPRDMTDGEADENGLSILS